MQMSGASNCHHLQRMLPFIKYHHTNFFRRSFDKIHDWFLSDARHYQMLFLTLFLSYGLFSLNWELDAATITVTFFTCLLTQSVFTAFTTNDYRSLKSAFISAMSLCLMLRSNSVAVMAIASGLSISSKFLFRVQAGEVSRPASGHKHIFNPTNFGIITTMLLTGNAWISPGQWGSSGLWLFIIGLLGMIVLLRAKRLDTAVAFLFTFGALTYLRSVLMLGWETDFFLHQMSSGTLLLFSFFMITDPVSTPSHPHARLLWAAIIGAIAFYLANYHFVNGAPLWALFFLSPLTPLLDRFFIHQKYSWTKAMPVPSRETGGRISFLQKLFPHT